MFFQFFVKTLYRFIFDKQFDLYYKNLGQIYEGCLRAGLQIERILAYFTHLKCQRRIGDDVGNFTSNTFLQKKRKKKFVCENDPLICFIHLIMQEYDSKCLKMYLIALKVFKIC
jgi:hypothetical protein